MLGGDARQFFGDGRFGERPGVADWDHGDVGAVGRSDEIGRPVGRAGYEEKDPGHDPYHGHMDQLVEPILEITDVARDKILEVRAAEADADSLALWVEVSGEQAGAYTYAMELRPLAGAGDADVVQRHDDLAIVLGAESIEKLVGATLDCRARNA